MTNEPIYTLLAERADHYDQAGKADQAARFYRMAGEQALTCDDNGQALLYLNQALQRTPDSRPLIRYQLLLLRESIYALQGERQAQIRDLRNLEALADQLDDDRKRAEVGLLQAQRKMTSGDYSTAMTILKLAFRLAQQQQDGQLQVDICLTWGKALVKDGQYDTAQVRLSQALEQTRAISNPNLEADALRLLGLLANDQNNLSQAKMLYEQALALYQQVPDRRGESDVLNNLGNVHLAQGAFYRAQQVWEQARETYIQLGDQLGQAKILANLGVMFLDLGAYDQAQQYFQQGLVLCQRVGERFGECLTTINLALVHHHLDHPQQALEHAQHASQIADDMENRRLQGFTFGVLGHAHSALNQWSEATDAYWQSLSLWLELDLENLLIEAYAGLARVAVKQDQLEQAQAYVAEIMLSLSADKPLEGVELPFLIYLTCYQVLQANQDPRADDVLRTAHQALQLQASEIRDPELRRSFLENVDAHRELIRAFEAT